MRQFLKEQVHSSIYSLSIAAILEKIGLKLEANEAWSEFFKIISAEHSAAPCEQKTEIEKNYGPCASRYILRIAKYGDENDVPRAMYAPFCQEAIRYFEGNLEHAMELNKNFADIAGVEQRLGIGHRRNRLHESIDRSDSAGMAPAVEHVFRVTQGRREWYSFIDMFAGSESCH